MSTSVLEKPSHSVSPARLFSSHFLVPRNVTRGKVNAFELRGSGNPVSVNQSEQKAFVFELSNDSLIGQTAVRLSNRKHSLSFEPH